MERIVLNQISTILKNAGYVKRTPASSRLHHDNHTNSKFHFKLPVKPERTLTPSTKSNYVFECASENVWLVCGSNKQEYGRFMSEEWALKWVDVLIRTSLKEKADHGGIYK